MSIANVFDFVTQYRFEPTDFAVFFTLLFLEGVLSFDNAAVLAAMVRRLPMNERKKALLYGLGGAYVFRVSAILGVTLIIRYPILKVVGGLYLVYLMTKHLMHLRKGDNAEHDPPKLFGMKGFWSVVVAVEIMDLAFALDQVLVAVAFTKKTLLIVLAAMTAILFLRLAAFYMTKLMDWFPALETLAYIAVGFVGTKLIVADIAHRTGHEAFAAFLESEVFSASVTLSLLFLPVATKFVIELVRARRSKGAERDG